MCELWLAFVRKTQTWHSTTVNVAPYLVDVEISKADVFTHQIYKLVSCVQLCWQLVPSLPKWPCKYNLLETTVRVHPSRKIHVFKYEWTLWEPQSIPNAIIVLNWADTIQTKLDFNPELLPSSNFLFGQIFLRILLLHVRLINCSNQHRLAVGWLDRFLACQKFWLALLQFEPFHGPIAT